MLERDKKIFEQRKRDAEKHREICDTISLETGLSIKDIDTIVGSMFSYIKECLVNRINIRIMYFGTFKVNEKKRRHIRRLELLRHSVTLHEITSNREDIFQLNNYRHIIISANMMANVKNNPKALFDIEEGFVMLAFAKLEVRFYDINNISEKVAELFDEDPRTLKDIIGLSYPNGAIGVVTERNSNFDKTIEENVQKRKSKDRDNQETELY